MSGRCLLTVILPADFTRIAYIKMEENGTFLCPYPVSDTGSFSVLFTFISSLFQRFRRFRRGAVRLKGRSGLSGKKCRKQHRSSAPLEVHAILDLTYPMLLFFLVFIRVFNRIRNGPVFTAVVRIEEIRLGLPRQALGGNEAVGLVKHAVVRHFVD